MHNLQETVRIPILTAALCEQFNNGGVPAEEKMYNARVRRISKIVMPAILQWIPRQVRFFGLLPLVLLIYFEFLRCGLILRNWDSARSVTWRELLQSLVLGARDDLRAACWITLPLFVLACLPSVGAAVSLRLRRFHFILLLAAIGVATLVLLVEYEFFKEFQTRFNGLAFDYMDQPSTVAGMVWYNYPVFGYAIAWMILMACFMLTTRQLLLRPFFSLAPFTLPMTVKEKSLRGISFIVLIGLLLAGMRRPSQITQVRSSFEFVNQVSANGLIRFGVAARDWLFPRPIDSHWLQQMPIDEARAITARLVMESDEKLLAPGSRTLLRVDNDMNQAVTLKKTNRPPNVVLVLMESFSARFVGACGSKESITPEFDNIARQGILFDHVLSGGTHTHQGIFCSLLGFPNLPGFGYLMKTSASYQPFASLPRILKRAGYSTMFLYCGDSTWDNAENFLDNQGMDRFISNKDFVNPKYRDAVWGVSDQDLFERAVQEFEAADKVGPFFATLLTISNHAPFLLPEPLPFDPTTEFGEMNPRINSMRYADWAIGRFIEQSREHEYFKNTLFIFVGDHGFSVLPDLTELHLLYHHVPLLFYSPSLLPPGGSVRHVIASHVNIAPTITGLLGLTKGHAFWGKNLLSSDVSPQEHFVIFKNADGREVGMIRQDKLLVLDFNDRPHLYRYNLGFPPSVTPLDETTYGSAVSTMENDLRSYIEAAMTDLSERRVGFMPAVSTIVEDSKK